MHGSNYWLHSDADWLNDLCLCDVCYVYINYINSKPYHKDDC